ncbi:MAG: nitroreductase family deazaflavin-dependent oxidoreductase [Acidimicrobiales bacterium]|jgi:deazaflavin-dependent oxidoreductase (nitroreductase family)|nr:nitroreductase family deazaflavin-dependent oxidoreductase [Acidimicrobiales bacterium]
MTDDAYESSPVDFVADHVERYLASDGADGFEFNGAECIILTTTGRRTGKLRRTPLVRVHDGENYLVIASMGGAAKNPVWYLNLLANPEVTLQDRAEVHELVARTADADEKARRWPAALAAWPSYADYQAKTDRDIPLVVLEPR